MGTQKRGQATFLNQKSSPHFPIERAYAIRPYIQKDKQMPLPTGY